VRTKLAMGLRSWIGFAIVVVICAVLVVANFTVYLPARQRLAAVSHELAVSDSEQAFVAGHATDLERVLDFLPEKVDDPNEGEQHFLSQISAKLQSLDVVLTRVEPRKVQQNGSFTERTFRLEMEGGFRQLANFMRYLELMPEVVVVNSFEIHSKQVRQAEDHSATLTVTVIGY
jgi:Tfp pilus assembly protein PilO